MAQKDKAFEWLTIIPVIFCLFFIILSVGKLYQTGNDIHIIDYIDIFNSNTFSTYISMVICMAYQYFSARKNQEEKSGLSRRWISLTIIATAVYGAVAVFNASRYCLATTILMAIASIIYVFVFFKYMKSSK